MIFDCRFLKNPNWEDDLKNLNGTDTEVKNYLYKDKTWESFNNSLIKMMSTIIPSFEREGKSYLSIGLGCTGGQHRSVFVAEQLFEHLLDKDYDVKILHTTLQK